MGYRALLFCPDEKTARTVTQVLGELEFSVEPCLEPFAAVKKLMGEHFDAIVVDCDNEQNATLLFKSARNSTSNQASLAVAVVEGQAGVAKAFRIGANLVLTKPINVEQAKGTLRVARGLLRKGDPSKPGAAAPTPAAAPAKPAAAKPVSPAKPAPVSLSPSHPATLPPVPAVSSAWPGQPAASTAPAAQDDDLLEIEISAEESVPAAASSVASPVLHQVSTPVSQAPSAPQTSASSFGSGAASAPAPAREAQESHAAEALFEKPTEASPLESSGSAAPAPSFTFGGANLPVESRGGSKKILVGVAAVALVVVGLYFGWTYFQGRASQPVSTAPPPVTTSQTAKPSHADHKPAPSIPSSSSSSQPAAAAAAPVTNSVNDGGPVPEDDAPSKGESSTKSATSGSAAADKAAATVKPDAAPLVVKGGSVRVLHEKPAATEAPAPDVMGIATPGSAGPPSELLGGEDNGPKPVLQTLHISQGVSSGLLLKKVQPKYPPNALSMRVEGTVELLATISKTGAISSVKVLRGEPLLARAAEDAVKQWKYKPYLLNDEPVEIQTQITINFKLPN